MAFDDVQVQNLEQINESTAPQTNGLAAEARAGLQELIESGNKHWRDITTGQRRSYVSQEFGKPTFFEGTSQSAAPQTPDVTVGPVESGGSLPPTETVPERSYADCERIHSCLDDVDSWMPSRSWSQTEKDIRDSISTMNSGEIAQLDQAYRTKYNIGIREALLQNDNLSEATKMALDVYLKGTDKRTDDDTKKLIDIAIKEAGAPVNVITQDGQAQFQAMWQEAFRAASPEARQAFMESGQGKAVDKLADVTGFTMYESFRDYAQDGHLSTATKISSNESFWGDNEAGIEQALRDMSATEREQYKRGGELAQQKIDESTLAPADRQALQSYRDIRGALESAGNATELAQWEDLINCKESGPTSEAGGQAPTDAAHPQQQAAMSDREAFDRARDEAYASRNGIGARLVDAIWDGTGYMADDALNKYAADLAQASANSKDLTPEQQQQLNNQLQTNLDQFRSSKAAASDAVVDASIATVAVGGALFTDGASLGLLAATGVGVGAGTFKVGAKAAIQGADYDFGSQAGVDFTTGLVDGALSFVGPAEIGAALKIGDKAAVTATETAAATGLKKVATEYALDMTSGALGSGASGLVHGAAEWDSQLSFADNMKRVAETAGTSAAFGAAGAAAFATAFRAGSKGLQAISEHFSVPPGQRLSAEQLEDLAKMTGRDDVVAGYDNNGDIELISKGSASVNLDSPSLTEVNPSLGKDAISDTDTVPTLWWPPRDLTEIPNEGKEAHLARARASKLYKADVVESFVEGAEQFTTGWEDLTALSERAAAQREAFERAQLRYENEVVDKLPADLQACAWNTNRVREALAGDADSLQILEEFVKRRDESSAVVQTLNQALQSRQSEVKAAMSKFANEQGLPEPKVFVQDKKFMPTAGAKYDAGAIILRKSALLSPDTAPQLIGAMYHEVTHGEQDYVIIRNLADEIHVGKELTTQQILEMKELYANRTGCNLSDEYLMKAIKKRDGRYLSPQDAARATELAEAFKNNAPVGQAWIDAENTFESACGDLSGLSPTGDGSFKLIQNMAEDATHAQRTFGDTIPSDVEELIELYQRREAGESIAWPDQQANDILRKHLNERMEAANAERQSLYARYMAGIHEQEAFVMGERARLMAMHPDVPEPPATTAGGTADATAELPRRVSDTLVPGELSAIDGTDVTVEIPRRTGGPNDVTVEIPRPAAGPNDVTVELPQRAGGPDDVTVELPRRTAGDTSGQHAIDMNVDTVDLGPKNSDGSIREDLGSSTVVTIGGKGYELFREGGDQWYYGKEPPKVAASPVKVHVFGVNADDLGRLQEVLIPALNDSESGLADLVTGWKTMDPRYAIGNPSAKGTAPGASDQNAKMFTIFAGSAEDALRIQSKVDEILAAHPDLRLEETIDTGNVDRVSGLSGRVGVCRELYRPSPDSTPGKPLILIDKELSDKIHGKLGTSGKLSYTQLRALELSTELQPNTLTYDSRGNLVLKVGPKSSYQGDAIYVPELGAGKGMDVDGRLRTDRPALYALAKRFGLDQADIAAGLAAADPSEAVTETFERNWVSEDAPTEEIPLPRKR